MADLAPDQSGGPTWGQIAMPATPSAMAVYSPGIQIMGGLAADTAFNAKRAQNLAAFEEYQRLNPNATAADLSHAAEGITGGDSLLGGSFTPAVMADIANKNRLQLQSQQAKEQGDITAGYMTAMNQAIDTATTPEEWVQKTKALMPQSSWQSFDSYIGGKNTVDMFKVYQQRRVAPIIKDGTDFMWDNVDQYTTAAGGNAALGKMAFDLAKPIVDAKKLQEAEKNKLTDAQIAAQYANVRQSDAAAQAEVVHAGLYRQQTLNEQTAGNAARQKFWDDQVLGDNFTRDALTSGNPVNRQKAHDTQLNIWRDTFGTGLDDEFEKRWNNADATVAGQTSAANVALSKQQAVNMMLTVFQPETDKLKSQVAPDNLDLAANGTDTKLFGTLDGDAKKLAQQRAISLTRSLLASKEMVTSDADTMKRIIAQGVLDGKSDTEITSQLMNTVGNKGYPVYGPGAAIQSEIEFNTPGRHGAVNTGDVLDQVGRNVKDASGEVDKAMAQLAGRPVRGVVQKPQGDVIADAQRVNEMIKKNSADIDRIIYEMQSPSLQGEYWGKQDKPAAISALLEQKRQLTEKGNQLALMLANRPGAAAASTAAASVVVGGTPYAVNPDLSNVSPQDMGQVSHVASEAMDARQQIQTRGGTISTQPGLDGTFMQYLSTDQDVQRITTATITEAGRLLASVTKPVPQSTSIKTYNKNIQPPPTSLTPADVKNLVDRMVTANKEALGNGVGLVQRNLENLIMLLQAQGKLPAS